ncbi:MAG: hypothetical protein H6835_04870 [Planctomycetes bacterium]|nr:hypothetical protein [Planctomycetota bacterium]
MVRSARFVASAAAIACLVAPVRAQDDLRDKVVLQSGRVVAGRVVQPFAAEELVVLQGGKRVRVEPREVLQKDLVADRVREFFARRLRHKSSPRAQRYLVDWAEENGLPGLARALAMLLVLDDDDDEPLHELLGHKKTSKGWQWPLDGKFYPFDKFEAALPKQTLRIVGERFAVRCDAGLAVNLRALLDLEHLGVVWMDRFGAELDLAEVLKPIEVRTFRNVDEFPKWGFRPRPYYEPPPHDDLARTFFSGPSPQRPDDLFFVGAEGLLYRTMIGQSDRQDRRDRVCSWLEVGLGMYMQNTMQGDAGFAEPGPLQAQDMKALQALGRGYRLTHLVHLPMYASFYLTDDTPTATNWAAATMFVTWLLRDDNQPDTRAAFLRYVKAALAQRQGDSSSTFDREMGRPIEQFDEPWRAWLEQRAGF